jgi:hypothetical protein
VWSGDVFGGRRGRAVYELQRGELFIGARGYRVRHVCSGHIFARGGVRMHTLRGRHVFAKGGGVVVRDMRNRMAHSKRRQHPVRSM